MEAIPVAVSDRAFSTLGVEPHEAVYVADNPYKDFGGPERVGMNSIWLNDRLYNRFDEPLGQTATWVVDGWVKRETHCFGKSLVDECPSSNTRQDRSRQTSTRSAPHWAA